MVSIIKIYKTRIFIILLLFSFLWNIYINENNEKNNFDIKYKKIEEFEKYISKSFFSSFFFENEASEIKKFLKMNENGLLINENRLINFKRNNNPDVSVIITVFNQAECFYKGLRSIQNQSLRNIEIIMVDDCSSDNSVDIIEKYQKEDNRIILIKHMINYGTIKSRSDAIKLAKGKYITIIDGDDLLAQKNILFYGLNIANIGNLDIVEFKLIYNYKSMFKGNGVNEGKIKNINNRIIYQPELKYIFIKLNQLWSLKNRNICQKLIKNEVFKEIIKYIGPKYTEDFIIQFEDSIMALSLFFLSKSYYLLKKVGYYRSKCECLKCLINEKKFIHNRNKLDSMKYINFLSDKLTGNQFNSQFIFYELLSVAHYNHNFELNNNMDFKFVYKIIDDITKKFSFFNKSQIDKITDIKNKLLKQIYLI